MAQIKALNPDEATETMNAWVDWAKNRGNGKAGLAVGVSVAAGACKLRYRRVLTQVSFTMDASVDLLTISKI